MDPQAHALAEEIQRAASTPVESGLPPPADPKTVDEVEAKLGFALPHSLRRVYCEVADGGFGPGEGLLSLREAAERYERLRVSEVVPKRTTWPEGLLPVVDHDPSLDCVECRTGRVLSWDPQELAEWSTPRSWRRSFSEVAPTVEAWLGEWVTSETLAERQARVLREVQEQMRSLTSEERRARGMPDVDWDEVLRWREDPEAKE